MSVETKQSPRLRTVRVHCEDGTKWVTNVSPIPTEDEVKRYFVGQRFNFRDTWEDDADRYVKATSVEFLPDLEIDPRTGHGIFPAG